MVPGARWAERLRLGGAGGCTLGCAWGGAGKIGGVCGLTWAPEALPGWALSRLLGLSFTQGSASCSRLPWSAFSRISAVGPRVTSYATPEAITGSGCAVLSGPFGNHSLGRCRGHSRGRCRSRCRGRTGGRRRGRCRGDYLGRALGHYRGPPGVAVGVGP